MTPPVIHRSARNVDVIKNSGGFKRMGLPSDWNLTCRVFRQHRNSTPRTYLIRMWTKGDCRSSDTVGEIRMEKHLMPANDMLQCSILIIYPLAFNRGPCVSSGQFR